MENAENAQEEVTSTLPTDDRKDDDATDPKDDDALAATDIACKTPAEPAPPQAPDHIPFADRYDAFVKFDTFDIEFNHIIKYLDPKDADTHSDSFSFEWNRSTGSGPA